MIKISFYLHRPDKKISNIDAKLQFKSVKKFSIGKSIEVNKWDVKKKKPKTGYKYYGEINSILNVAQETINGYNKSVIESNEFDLEKAKALVLKAINNENVSNTEPSILEKFNQWQDYKQKHGENAKSTATKRRTVIKQFIAFSIYYNKQYKASEITDDILKDFRHYLNNIETKTPLGELDQKKIIADRTASKYISILKQFLKWTGNKDLEFNVQYKSYPKPALKKEEFELIKNTVLDIPYLENVRQLFIIEVLTAMRISDFKKLFKTTLVDFKAERIQVPLQKTDEYLTIPFLSDVGKYLLKVKQGEIKIISEAKYNQYLKSLFERIGINRECHIITQLKNQKIVQTKPFFEIVSTHTARRSFVTLSYQMGLSREEIRMIGGWSDEKEMRPYLNIVEEDAFKNAKKVWGQK